MFLQKRSPRSGVPGLHLGYIDRSPSKSACKSIVGSWARASAEGKRKRGRERRAQPCSL
jgi:hypothetical protein